MAVSATGPSASSSCGPGAAGPSASSSCGPEPSGPSASSSCGPEVLALNIVSEEEGWKEDCITIAADYGGHPQLGRGSKIDRLYLGEENENPKLYYPPKNYLYVVMWSPEGVNGYPYEDANQNGGFAEIRFGKAPEGRGEQE